MQHFSVKIGELFLPKQMGVGQAPAIGRPEVFDVAAIDQPQAEEKAQQKYIDLHGSNPVMLRTLFVGLGRNVKRGDRRQVAEMEARLNAKWFIATGKLPDHDSAFSWTALPKPTTPAAQTTPQGKPPAKSKQTKPKATKSETNQTPNKKAAPAPEPQQEQALPASWVGVRSETQKVDREANTF